MTDPLESRIADELHGRATALDVPPPPIDVLVQGGLALRARRRRRVRVLAATAAVIAVGLAIGIPQVVDRDGNHPAPAHRPSPGPTKAPKSVDDLPTGPPPAVPYLHAGELHFGQVAVRTSADELVSTLATVLVGDDDKNGVRWSVLEGAELRRIPQLDNHAPRLDPSGTNVVWTSYPDSATTRVNVWNVESRRELAHVDLPAPHADCCGGGQQIELWGVDEEGTVYWRDSGSADRSTGDYVWVPGHTPRRLVGADDRTGITPLGPITASGTYGNVALDGRFQALGHLDDPSAVWGSGPVVAAAGPEGVVVRQMDADNKFRGPGVRMRLPAGAEVVAMSFESSDQLLLRVRESAQKHVLVRCLTDSGSCERALELPAPSRWVFPQALE